MNTKENKAHKIIKKKSEVLGSLVLHPFLSVHPPVEDTLALISLCPQSHKAQ
jgi:hypothetical protein